MFYSTTFQVLQHFLKKVFAVHTHTHTHFMYTDLLCVHFTALHTHATSYIIVVVYTYMSKKIWTTWFRTEQNDHYGNFFIITSTNIYLHSVCIGSITLCRILLWIFGKFYNFSHFIQVRCQTLFTCYCSKTIRMAETRIVQHGFYSTLSQVFDWDNFPNDNWIISNSIFDFFL